MSKKLLEDDEKIIRQQIAFRKPYGEIINFMVNQLGLTNKEAQGEYKKQKRTSEEGPIVRDEKFLSRKLNNKKSVATEISKLSYRERQYVIGDLKRRIKWMEQAAPLKELERRDLLIYRIALEALQHFQLTNKKN